MQGTFSSRPSSSCTVSSESACSATVVSVCGMERRAEQERRVIYSFGINGESLSEAALLERVPGREVWGYELPWTALIENTPTLMEPTTFRNNLVWESRPRAFIDVPKIDIERAEFDTLTAFLAAHKSLSPFFTTLPIELHAWDDYAKFDFFRDWWAAPEAVGLPFLD
ncbi:hypothetical protein EDB89DRAFT_2133124 [Lactarius sanguifluus]|nr:hypothetical protein EDB89DRAFT_2133124 [Lactarius sanguifluus]